ncbi:DCC1-like thiol-disulfide oxidoreductase family protein [Aliikangiella coralliicola]|uniref:DUF393 domain-containing protein n=1 Tax=Aliikangiella coralliicola TaxID=2592383 RepID=A0A545UEV2_9GAMM|nr:DCC1-like thiol-disulfide oxidoreductase family protein [Aliikangiella coralliicola]TQV87994.1 DUF393 domain-containing protein [Aliikangiella coralliicola]
MKYKKMMLAYDKECPLCENYWRMVRIRKSVGKLELINAREDSDFIAQIREAGLDVDKGIVLKLDEQIYYGAEAVHILALLSSKVGWFNWVNFKLFSNEKLSRFIYPFLRGCRSLLLKVLGKSKINRKIKK